MSTFKSFLFSFIFFLVTTSAFAQGNSGPSPTLGAHPGIGACPPGQVVNRLGANVGPPYGCVPISGAGAVTSVGGANGIVITGTASAPIVGLPSATAAQLLLENAGATAFAPVTLTGSCTITSLGVITCPTVLSPFTGAVQITANSGTGSDFITNVNVNGVLNVKSFGASGSQQTASCTAVANTSSLTGCSGGDFVVGSTIRIPVAGAPATISTPVAPTLACAAFNSGSSCSSIARVGAISASTATTTLTLTIPATVMYGQAITINGAGSAGGNLTTTVAAPAYNSLIIVIATPALTTVSGAVVTLGTLTIGYEIAAVQGLPNGAITPAGPAQTVTQTAQTPIGNGGTQYVYTTVSAYSVSNAFYYIIYKSINGGPYNYYTITHATTFNDSGDLGPHKFTCNDVGVPCTAPSATVPNGVFAKITAIVGSTYTIAANTNQPQYTLQQALPAATYPSQPTINGTVTLTHDDTPAFQAVRNKLLTFSPTGHATVQIPAGDYNVSAGDQYGNQSVLNFIGLDYVTLQGVGWASRIHQLGMQTGPDQNFATGTCGGTNQPSGINAANRCRGAAGLTAYNLIDPQPFGQTFVTLASVGDAVNFTVGQYVQIYTDSNSYPGNSYQENNVVTSVDTNTGAIGLLWQLNKYYSATLVSPYSNCSTCAAAPKIVPLTFGLAESNIIFENFWFEGDVKFFNMNNFDLATTKNLYIHSIANDESGADSRRLSTLNTIVDESSLDAAPNFITGAVGDRDTKAIGNDYTMLGVSTQQSCQEESSNVLIADNRLTFIGTYPSSLNYIFRDVNCSGQQIINNEIDISGANALGVFSPVTTTAFDIFKATNNIVHIDRTGPYGSVLTTLGGAGINDPNIDISDNRFFIENDTNNGTVEVLSKKTLPQYSMTTVPNTSGVVSVASQIGYRTILNVGMTGNVTQVSLGGTNYPGLFYAIQFTQSGSGGLTIPSNTTQTGWVTPGSVNIDWSITNGVVPVINPAANAVTTIWFYDDGTTIHEVTVNVAPPPIFTLMTSAPSWARSFGDGNEGTFSGSGTLSGEHWYTTFNCTGALSAGSRVPLIIRATTSITLGASCALNFNAVSTAVGFLGGAGGGGGGGAGTGVTGSATGWLSTASPAFQAAGAGGTTGNPGAVGGSPSSPGSAPTWTDPMISSGLPTFARLASGCGGAPGGAGANSGGTAGNGGSCVELYSPVITNTVGATIDVSGGNGSTPGTVSEGGGGGGGGGSADEYAKTFVGNTLAQITSAGGGQGGQCTIPALYLKNAPGDVTGSGASLVITGLTTGGLDATKITVTGGTNYTAAPSVIVVPGTSGLTGSPAVTVTVSGGAVQSPVTVVTAGSGGTLTTETLCQAGGYGGNGRMYQGTIQ